MRNRFGFGQINLKERIKGTHRCRKIMEFEIELILVRCSYSNLVLLFSGWSNYQFNRIINIVRFKLSTQLRRLLTQFQEFPRSIDHSLIILYELPASST